MLLKTLIVTIILIAFVILALGIKMLFKKHATFEMRSCSFVNQDDTASKHSNRKIEVKKLAVETSTKKDFSHK